MYNLFVAYDPTAWRGEPHEMQVARVLTGYTADPLREKYGTLNDNTVQALQNFPALFVNEKQHGLPAKIGWITRVRHRGREVRIEYEIEPLLPEIPMDRLLQLQWELDFTEWELNTTHWALKDVDLFPVLMEAGLLDVDFVNAQPQSSKIKTIGLAQTAPGIEARPTVFRVPTEPRDNNLVSVMMPFSPEFDQVYATIQNAALVVNLRCERADNIWEAEEVIQDIFSLIYRSGIVVCDFTNQNPNVFYEAGIAHTLGRPLVPISQNEKDVPFDLRHHRFLRYLANGEGLNALFARLAPRLNTLRKRLPASPLIGRVTRETIGREPMPAQIDQFSLVTAPLSLYFNDTHLSDATGFIWQQGRQNYLITSWHVVTARNSQTGKQLNKHGGRPNKIHALFNTRIQQFLKQPHIINIRDAEDKPLWLAHPSRGRGVDAVAIPLPYADEDVIFALHPINKYIALQLTVRVAMEVFVLGYPFGPEPPGYPVWKRGSMASEPDLAHIGPGHYLIDTASRPGMSGSPAGARRKMKATLSLASYGRAHALKRSLPAISSMKKRIGDSSFNASVSRPRIHSLYPLRF